MAGRFSVETVFKMIDRVTAPVSRMQHRVGRFTRSFERGLRSVNRAIGRTVKGIKRVGATAIKFGAIGIGAVTTAVTLLVREFSRIEDAQASFTPLLGSAEKAAKLVQAINDTAASTPFQFENLAATVSQLLPVMNGNIEETIKTVRMLGDTAGGNAQKLERITRGFTKAMLKGKVDMEALNMIAEAGVPIFTEMAQSMGVTNKAFFKLVTAGKVTTKQLTASFEKMTSKGGIFFGGMEIASKTTTGLFSTLKDNISLTAAELGSVLAPTVKELITHLTGVAKRVRAWISENRELINTKFLAFVKDAKAALVSLGKGLAFLFKHRSTLLKIIASVIALSAALQVLGVVMAVVNVVMLANPISLIVLAVLAAVAAVALAIIWWDELKATFQSLPGPIKGAVAAMTAPVRWMIRAASLVVGAWAPIKTFFTDLWGGVTDTFDKAMGKIDRIVDRLRMVIQLHKDAANAVGGFIFGDDDEGADSQAQPKGGRQTLSPQDRTAKLIEERRTTSSAEVTIRDETKRAEVTKGSLGGGISLQPSGAF